MYKTKLISVQELARRMRNMEVGTVINLLAEIHSDQWFGIRRLPDDILDNGLCWIADIYGGGKQKAFSDGAHTAPLESQLISWLSDMHLLADEFGIVRVKVEDGTERTVRYDFKKTVVEPQQNAVACIDFGLVRTYRMYLSVPKDATMDAIAKLGRRVLCTMTPEEFGSKVLDTSTGGEPFIADEDIDWMGVNQSDRGWNIDTTTEPVGTVIM